jgi:hypothetical protein
MHACVGLLITLVVSVAFGATPLVAQESLTLEFGGKRLVIPRGYFDKGPGYNFTPDRIDPEIIYLRVYFPEFSVAPTRPRPDAGHGDNLRIQLHPRPASLNIRYASVAPARSEGPLEVRHTLKMFATEPRRNGANTGTKPQEVYFSNQDRVITNLIICTPGYPSPPCNQYFSTGDYYFNLTYHMRSVSEWQEISARVRALIESFVVR